MSKILVVDDEENISKFICKSLKKEGHSVLSAYDYDSAINRINRSSVDLIISDVMMPYSGGFDIVDYIKSNERLKNIPVILVTGMDKDILDSSTSKANAVLSKPFEMSQLIELVNANIILE